MKRRRHIGKDRYRTQRRRKARREQEFELRLTKFGQEAALRMLARRDAEIFDANRRKRP